MQQSGVTLKKISLLSGFSVSTVSKALNHKEDISEKTKNVILDLAKQHNYKPNYSALSLRKKETKTFGVIIPEISNQFYGNLLSEIEKIAFENGYRLMILQSLGSSKKEKDCMKLISDGSVDGIIVLSSKHNDCLLKIKDDLYIPPYIYFKIDLDNSESINIPNLASLYFNNLLEEVKRTY
ncbi:LacI family DNA-binding transcriptional regulator [Bizionia sp. KMM 8389]